MLTDGKEEIKVRLVNIDCPERNQPFSAKAKEELGKLVHEKNVKIWQTGHGQDGGTIAFVILTDICVNKWLIGKGLKRKQ